MSRSALLLLILSVFGAGFGTGYKAGWDDGLEDGAAIQKARSDKVADGERAAAADVWKACDTERNILRFAILDIAPTATARAHWLDTLRAQRDVACGDLGVVSVPALPPPADGGIFAL